MIFEQNWGVPAGRVGYFYFDADVLRQILQLSGNARALKLGGSERTITSPFRREAKGVIPKLSQQTAFKRQCSLYTMTQL